MDKSSSTTGISVEETSNSARNQPSKPIKQVKSTSILADLLDS